jgi:acyl carrier protein
MDVFTELKNILTELLDLEDQEITPETYLITELGAESIDLLELAIAINDRFQIPVKDDEVFLRRFREYLAEAAQQMADPVSYLVDRYPFLTKDRVAEIVCRTPEGPQLKIKDIMDYVMFYSRGRSAE